MSSDEAAGVPVDLRSVVPGWELTPLEAQMLVAAKDGDVVDRGEGPFELAEMQMWSAERTVRAAVLRHLVTESWPVSGKGVRLRGVRVSGRIDLEDVALRCAVSLDHCYLDANEPACFDHVTASRITLTGCHLAGLTGDMLTARQVDLSGSIFAGPLELRFADIAGQLICRGTQITGTNKDGDALSADGIRVGGGAFFDVGFISTGAVRLAGARIAGELSFSEAQITGGDSDGDSLVGDRLTVDGAVSLDKGFTAAGAIRLLGASITGQLSLSGAKLTGCNRGGDALQAGGLKVGADVFLRNGFTAAGVIWLAGADITGQLTVSGATLTGSKDGRALVADRMRTGGDVFLDAGFTATGAVRLAAADIGGQLNCRTARLTGADDGDALIAERLKTGGDVFLDEGFTTTTGAVRLFGADIGGHLICHNARLAGTDRGKALVADGLRVAGDVALDECTAAGTVSLPSAQVGGTVCLTPAMLAETQALDAPGMQVAGTLQWAPARPVSGEVNLEAAIVGHLVDDWGDERPNGHWPAGKLRLDGFSYGQFGGHMQATVEQRLAWIRSQYPPSAKKGTTDFATQPYEQLAAVYRQAGQETQARRVAIARRADLRKYGNLNWYRWAGNWFLDKTIKYGYQAWRAGVGLAVVLGVIIVLSIFAQDHQLMIPVGNTEGLHPTPSATKCTSSYPCFYPVGYAVDTVLPVINVHQADNWGPNGSAHWGWAWVSATWAATGLGWALATLLIAGYTGLVRQE